MTKQAILMFHGVGDVPANIPAAEVPYWITKAFFDEIVTFVKDRSNVVLTFDDGNVTDLDAARTLAAAGLKGSFYVLAGRIGKPGYLGREDLRQLVDLGMEVGLHGTNHVDWRRVDRLELKDETVTSRAVLADAIGQPITSVAIPFGAYNKPVMRHLESQSFDRIYTSDNGLAVPGSRFLRRNPVMDWQTIRDIEAIVDDRANPLTRLRRTIMPVIKRNLG